MKNRDFSIVKNFKREINLQTRSIKDKTLYTRKMKHKQTKNKYLSDSGNKPLSYFFSFLYYNIRNTFYKRSKQ